MAVHRGGRSDWNSFAPLHVFVVFSTSFGSVATLIQVTFNAINGVFECAIKLFRSITWVRAENGSTSRRTLLQISSSKWPMLEQPDNLQEERAQFFLSQRLHYDGRTNYRWIYSANRIETKENFIRHLISDEFLESKIIAVLFIFRQQKPVHRRSLSSQAGFIAAGWCDGWKGYWVCKEPLGAGVRRILCCDGIGVVLRRGARDSAERTVGWSEWQLLGLGHNITFVALNIF